MSHTTQIQCEKCGSTETVETQDWSISNDTLTFSFSCSCGFKKYYENVAPADLEKIAVSDENWYVQWSGLSKEKLASYIYPPDIMESVDLERRKMKGVVMKGCLKNSRQSNPKCFEDNWWEVYKVVNPKMNIHYNHVTKFYKVLEGKKSISYNNVIELGNGIKDRF